MNYRIKQLTRNYLNSLNLPYYQLNDNQKQEIIRINGETEWIIFHSGSLKAEEKEYTDYESAELIWVEEPNRVWDRQSSSFMDIDQFLRLRVNLVGQYRLGEWEERDVLDRDINSPTCGDPIGTKRQRPVWGRIRNENGQASGEHKLFYPGRTSAGIEPYHPENYNLTTLHLKEICQEVVKIYAGEENITIDSIIFMGGSGKLGGRTQPAFDVSYFTGRVNDDCWVAINKKVAGEQYKSIDIFCVNDSRQHWKKETNLNNLLNNNGITSSREEVATDTNQQTPPNQPPPTTPPPHTHTPPPPRTQTTITRDLTFLIDHVIPGYNGDPHYIILSAPLVVEGTNIHFSSIQSNDPLLQDGNQVVIRDVEFGSDRSEVDTFREEINIKNHFRTIELVSPAPSSPPPGGFGSSSTPSQPNNPPPPPSFPDVAKKNQDLVNEENNFLRLNNELKDIINKNKNVVQEAQTLGLSLTSFTDNALDYFQTAFFNRFDASQPLNSPDNQRVNDKNNKIRQKVLNLKNNIYQVYNNNVKELADKKQENQNPPPENELTKLKKRVIGEVSKILADPDNLRNIDLNALAGGKYKNWKNDIMGLSAVDEVNDYLTAFSTALKEKGVEEKEVEKQENNDNSSDRGSSNSQGDNDTVDDNFKKVFNKLPLSAAKNVAQNKIRELFRKYHPDLEKLKEIWVGSDSWMEHLKKFNSSDEILVFLEKLEKSMIQQSQNRETGTRTRLPQNSSIVPFLIISFILLFGLILVLLLHRRRRRKKLK